MKQSRESDPPLSGCLGRTPWAGFGLPLFLAAAAFFVYLPSLQSDFVYDARTEILDEGFITSPKNLPAVLSLRVLGENLMLGTRPGQLLYLMLNAAVWGTKPWGYHLSGNLLHAANVALLFVLLRRLAATEAARPNESGALKVELAAAVATLVFALHPLAVESVAEVSYSSSLLVTFFTLAALLAATAFHPENPRAAGITGAWGALCACAAVTCKESGVAAAFLLVAYRFLFRRREANVPWRWFLGGAMTMTAAFLALRFLWGLPGQAAYNRLGASYGEIFLVQARLWVFMMGKLLWPVRLSADYTLDNVSGLSTPFALAVLAGVVVLQACLAAKSRLGALGVAIYWLGLATVSNFVPLYRIVADRFYYLPLAGVSMQLFALLLRMRRSSFGFWTAAAVCLASILPLTHLTLSREKVFAGDLALWGDTIQASPLSWTGHANLGKALAEDGRVDEAIVQFHRALEINPTSADACYYLGMAFSKKGNMDEAMAQYRKALKLNPRQADAHNNLGNVLLKRGDLDGAMAQYREALEINPRQADAHINLGGALFQKRQVDRAIAEFQKALEIKPDDAEAHYNFGIALVQTGRMDEAMAQFETALKIKPGFVGASDNLGDILLQKGRVDEAIVQYRKALEINPNDAGAHANLGIALFQKGETDEAIIQFQAVVRLNPQDGNAQNNLARARAMARRGAGFR